MTATAASSTSKDVYHPDWLAYEASVGGRQPPIEDFNVAIAGFNQASAKLAKQWPSLDDQLTVTEETIEPDNTKVRIYQPKNGSTSLPLMIYFHGGGLLMGNLDTEDPHCRILAAKTPCIVVSVDYPLAPKYNMDEIFSSVLESVNWIKNHDPPLTTSSRLLVAGGSAGACIAIQLAYHFAVSATADAPSPISGLVAMFPIASPSAVTPYTGKYSEIHRSIEEKATGAPCLEKRDMAKMCNIPQMRTTSPSHFPLLSPSLPLFPRTYIMNAEHDPARDDATVLAKRLAEEGGGTAVRHDYYPGLPHWFHWIPSIPEAHRMMDNTVEGVKWILDG